MSKNAQKRLLIILGETGDRITDTKRIVSARALAEIVRSRFPSRSYNFGTITLYMERLRERFMVTVTHQHGEIRYRLTDTGFDEACRLWDERDALGYTEADNHSVVDVAVGVVTTTKEFLVAPI